ncbi:MAG: hypothetical protein GY859_24090, partial [Desulfobacterales bacterium]|nr:hypothetical protein [Desulfobacterales bacterium]
TEKDLLQAATLFEVPAPLAVFKPLCEEQTTRRLLDLGLWDQYDDMVQPARPAAAVNPLARPRAGALPAEKAAELAEALAPRLFELWGGSGERNRPYAADLELTRLGILAENGEIVLDAAEKALIFLDKLFEYRRAAAMAISTMELLEKKRLSRPPTLLRVAADRCQQVGQIERAEKYIARAVDRYEADIAAGKPVDENDYSHALTIKARMLVRQGNPDEAEQLFRKVAAISKKLGQQSNYAVLLGDIARIRVSKGEVD